VKKFLKLVPLLGVVLMVGCAAPAGHIKAGDPSMISIGMTKDQVIQKLGKPETVTADGQTETLSYVLERPWWQDKPFRVKIVDGKVASYEVLEH
jgi:outer membrane protein assembly factor BamE (lipoprotein component of BamABCDE complex)